MQYAYAAVTAVLAVAALAMSGCATDVPENAVSVTSAVVPGATMHVWLEEEPGRTVFHGVFVNDSGRMLMVRNGFHLGAWDLVVLDASGADVRYHARTQCRDYDYQPLADGGERPFRFTWDHVVFATPEPCESGQVPAHEAVAPGLYTAVMRFRLAYEDPDTFRVEVPFAVAGPADDGPGA